MSSNLILNLGVHLQLIGNLRLRRYMPLLFLIIGSLSIACDDEEGTKCNKDSSCERGKVCEDGACVVVNCEWTGDCKSGQTCLSDLNQCSVLECGNRLDGIIPECPEGLVCNEEGPYRYSCSAMSMPSTTCEDASGCANASEGPTCCNGVCAMSCDVPIMMDMQVGGEEPPIMDMMPSPTTASLCTPCNNEATCGALGEGSRCTAIGDGSFCTSSCDGSEDCPAGFTCLSTLSQCVPSNFQCVACQQIPCQGGEFCDLVSGQCGPPQGLCGSCNEDSGCADGRVCRTVGSSPVCVQPCDSGCPEATTCVDGGCIPESGECDPCAGTCEGATPYCVEAEARCAECGPTVSCDEGLRCDLMTYTCTDALPSGVCVTDADCPGSSLCFNGSCVECFQDTDCPARNVCNTNSFTCEYSACAGVSCQRGSSCDASSGRCTPGCATNQDCVLPDVMECNMMTGQCYYTDGTCDLSGDAVCAPGGQCMPNPLAALDPTLPANCTCAKEDPNDPLSPDRIPCHPGQSCNDLAALLMLDLSSLGLEFDATCGEGLF